jgi:adenylate cyclase
VGRIGDDLRMDYTAQGFTVGLAQRMESLAEPNTCYLSADTARLVEGYFELEDLGEFGVKGVAEPVRVFELAGSGRMQTRFDVSRSRGLSRFVGRAADMQTLESALEQAGQGNGQVVGVVAEAGTGKSRLCFEFLEGCRARGHTVQVGRAVAHGRNIPFLPMLEAFRDYFGIRDEDPDRLVREKIAGRLLLTDEAFRNSLPVVFEFFGVPDPERPVAHLDPATKQKQLFGVLRGEIRGGNREGPLVTLIEDLHWLDEGSGAFLEQWVDAIAGSSALLLVNFRPEYTAGWMSRSYYRQIPLAPLGADAVRELLDDWLGRDESTRGLAGAIHERTGGNPFFTEEVVQSLIESGQLVGARGAYRLDGPVAHIQVPASVQALLASRIDRLADREKQVLQAAAVIGKDFAEPLLVAACERSEPEVREALAALREAEFVYEQSLYPVPEYAFKHPLTQEVALGSQLHDRRRHTHAKVAAALERSVGERLDESAGVIAHHWDQADRPGEACVWHASAARWAGVQDLRAANRHWTRAWELASSERVDNPRLAVEACTQLLTAGWRVGTPVGECDRLFREGSAIVERVDEPVLRSLLVAGYAGFRGLVPGSALDYVKYGELAREIADTSDDLSARCAARGYLVYAYWFAGLVDDCVGVCDELVGLTQGDPNPGAESVGFSPLIAAICWGKSFVQNAEDHAAFVRAAAQARQVAAEHGFGEMIPWLLLVQNVVGYRIEPPELLVARAREAARIADPESAHAGGVVREAACFAHYGARDWEALRTEAVEFERFGTEHSVRSSEPFWVACRSVASIELGRVGSARELAVASVSLARERGYGLYPEGFEALARCQLELSEPRDAVEATLEEWAERIRRARLATHLPALEEQRAALARREGDSAGERAALGRARAARLPFQTS